MRRNINLIKLTVPKVIDNEPTNLLASSLLIHLTTKAPKGATHNPDITISIDNRSVWYTCVNGIKIIYNR